jgi:hypothetical protein
MKKSERKKKIYICISQNLTLLSSHSFLMQLSCIMSSTRLTGWNLVGKDSKGYFHISITHNSLLNMKFKGSPHHSGALSGAKKLNDGIRRIFNFFIFEKASTFSRSFFGKPERRTMPLTASVP